MIKDIKFTYEEFSDKTDLSIDDLKLLEEAQKARLNAYAKYSDFKVGAALLLDNGKIITGNNQENAAYPSGLCAERTAIFYAIANYPLAKILKIAVIAGKDEENYRPVSPCGGCRQVLIEYETKQKSPIEIFFSGTRGKVIKFKECKQLLPFSFDESFL